MAIKRVHFNSGLCYCILTSYSCCSIPESTFPSFRLLQMAGRTLFDTTCASAIASAKPATSCAETEKGSLVFGTWLWTATAGLKMRFMHWRKNLLHSWRGACHTLVRCEHLMHNHKAWNVYVDSHFVFFFFSLSRYNSPSSCTVKADIKAVWVTAIKLGMSTCFLASKIWRSTHRM